MILLCIAATLSDHRQGIDVYRANVSNLWRANMISKTEQKGLWRNV